MKKIFYILVFVLSSACLHAAQVDLPMDSHGWTVLTPSSDSDVVYVDSVSGNDVTCRSYRTTDAEMGENPLLPAGSILPCATAAGAKSKVSDGHPDWMLFRRGQIFDFQIVDNRQRGKSVTEPFVYSAYGSAGALPIIRGGFSSDGNGNTEYLVVANLDFYRDTRDPSSVNYNASEANGTQGLVLFSHEAYHQNGILIEGCKFRYMFNGVNIAPTSLTGNSGVTFRRNVVLHSHSNDEGHSQGMLISNIDGVIIEENIFDHNGWLVQNDGDGTTEANEATLYNHNLYQTSNNNISIKNNVFMRASSINIKNANYSLTNKVSGLVIEDNLLIDGEIAISIGASDQSLIDGFTQPQVLNNVYTHGGASNPTNRETVYFLYNYYVDTGLFKNNLMINQNDSNLYGNFLYGGFYHHGSSYIDNIIHNVKNVTAFNIKFDGGGSTPPSGTFTGNKIDLQGGSIFYSSDVLDISGLSFSNNKYNTTKTANTWFTVNNVAKTNAQWQALTGDNSSFETSTYPDQTRDVDTYMGYIGGTATVQGFIDAARAQSRYAWDSRITAESVNRWIKAGFGIGVKRAATGSGGKALICGSGPCVAPQ